MAKLARNGLYTRVPSEVAWSEVDRLRALGWSSAAIASAAGIRHLTMEGAIQNRKHGRPHSFGAIIAAKLVSHGDPTEGSVAAQGTRRRLQGLARQGWDLSRLADMSGIGFSTLGAIRNGTTARTRARYFVTIRDLAAEFEMRVGPSTQARAQAEKRKWAGLLAWDDIDTDPHPSGVGPNRVRRDLVAEWDFLRAAGVSMHSAAQQLGVTVHAIEKAIERAKGQVA